MLTQALIEQQQTTGSDGHRKVAWPNQTSPVTFGGDPAIRIVRRHVRNKTATCIPLRQRCVTEGNTRRNSMCPPRRRSLAAQSHLGSVVQLPMLRLPCRLADLPPPRGTTCASCPDCPVLCHDHLLFRDPSDSPSALLSAIQLRTAQYRADMKLRHVTGQDRDARLDPRSP